METTKIIATAWENGQGSYGFQLKEEDRKRYFTRSWGRVYLHLPGWEVFSVNIDKDTFWNETCGELIEINIKNWFIENKIIPWPYGTRPRFELKPLRDKHFEIKLLSP